MSSGTVQVTRKAIARASMCMLGTAALLLPLAASTDAKPAGPVVIRGAGTTDSTELRLAYLASFPNGSLNPSVDMLNAGPMHPGDTGVLNSNPTLQAVPGGIRVGISRPADLPPDVIPANGLWATPVNFGPGSISRIKATYIAPIGPLPGGGFAIGINAKTGGSDDLPTDTRIAVTVNVRPGFLVRLNVPFGAVETTNMVLPQSAKDAIFSPTDPQPFTLELTIDRTSGKGTAKLTVSDQVYTLTFTLSDFLADGGPPVSAVGPGIAVNANAPGQTASVVVRDFRIYTAIGG
ncbi:MAG TPA: hypothetical protein VE820_13650 [Sphingomicrobium sp.]|nr:hypothetical protein [Sphingomicrobium sp.]